MLERAMRGELVARVNRIEGQLRGIRRMIDEPRPCVEILQQTAAAEAALARISHAVFSFHAEHCILGSAGKGRAAQRRQLKELVDIFDRRGR